MLPLLRSKFYQLSGLTTPILIFILGQAPSNEDAVKLGLAVLAAVNDFPALDISALTKFVQKS